MTDKEILEEVYRRLKESDDPHGWKTNPLKDGVTSFIEQEWQKQDEQELVDQYNRNREPKDHAIDGADLVAKISGGTLEKTDVAETERHRGLIIGEDGTVTKLT